ncbi:nectin-4-like [Mustelus asterias]
MLQIFTELDHFQITTAMIHTSLQCIRMESFFGVLLFFALSPFVCTAGEITQKEFAVSYVGMDVMLRCQLRTSQQDLTVIQVAWARKTELKKTLALYSPKFGISYPLHAGFRRLRFKNPSPQDAPLIITDLRMSDADEYKCKFTTFPNGSISREITLEVLAAPLPDRHVFYNTVYVIVVLLLLAVMLIRLTKLLCKASIRDIKSDPTELQQGDCQIEYAALSLQTSQTLKSQTGQVLKEEVPDCNATVYATVNPE